MRLLSLHLERYGAFTGRILAFRKDARLHVVLGANEAGKSTALAAVTDLLFGIEPRTRYAFLHDMPELRLGAEIEAGDGRRLAFRRRKGNRNTLVDEGDAALPEDALRPFLQGLSRPVFCRAFGLDAQALRAGGREMLDSEGEVGASLFAAASGLRGYRQLQGTLDAEATAIFAPRKAANRTFYQALDRHEEARKAIRASELRSGDWRELNEEIEAAGGRLDEIHAERRRIAAERARLERLRRVIPLIAGIDELEGRIAADPGLPETADGLTDSVTDSWTERLGLCIAAAERAGQARAQAQGALGQAERDLAAVPPDEGLIAHSEKIFEAFRGIDRFDKDGLDLPRIRSEAEGFRVELDRLAVRIGLPEADALKSRQPSDAARTRIEALIREGRDGAAALARLSQDLSHARDEHDRLAQGEGEDGPLIDPGPLRADLKALAGQHGGLHADLAKRDALDATIRREAGMLRAQGARLAPPVPDLPALIAAGLPSPEAVARFRQRLDALERERDRAADRLDAAGKAVADTRGRLRRLEAGRPIPTRAELKALRSERDRLFAPLRAAALGQEPVRPAAEAAAYEAALVRADRAADALAADAARVAEQAADLARLDAQEAEREAAKASLSEIEARIGKGLEAWRQAWAASNLVPGGPSEMAAWLGEVESLIDTHLVLEDRRVELDGLCARIAGLREPLAALGRRAGLDPLPGAEAGLLLTRVEDRIADLAASWEAARERQARARAAAEGLARIAAAHEAARVREAAWRGDWREAVAALSLREGAGPDEAESALAAWRAVPGALAERDNRLARVAGIERDMRAYADALARLAGTIAPDLTVLPTIAAMKVLHARLQAALKSESRRGELGKRRDAAAAARDEAARAAGEGQAGLAEHLASLHGLPAEAEAGALHARLVARRALRAELAERRAELARAADGLAEAELRADLSTLPVEAIDATLQDLRIADEQLDQRGKLAFSDRDRHERRRAELEAGIGAETASAQKKAAEAELQAEARQWAVLRFAGLMLSAAIGRHRAGQQDPLLTRAGSLFSALTGGAFSGLAQDYGEADEPRIVGRRPEGSLVPVEGLSEGTRDQLYLALRLAYLQDYASRAEPAPFVGDDLFSTFDDTRTGHGLEALAAIGDRIQPILFTHHRHVAELAEQRLGGSVDVVPL